jgi:hypothetical protein
MECTGTAYFSHTCGAWSLAVREEQTLTAPEKEVLRRKVGHKRDEELGGWTQITITITTTQ